MSDARRAPHHLVSLLLTAILGLLLGACGTQAIAGAVRPPRPSPPVVTIDWSDRTIAGALAAPWAIAFCEGEAPFVCVANDGHALGSIELLDWDLEGLDLDAWATDHLAWIAADRTEGCGDGYRVVADPVQQVTVAGRDGIRVSVTGLDADGTPVERSVLHAWDHQGRRFLLAAHGYADDSCLGRSFSDFTVADLRSFEPLLADLVEHMRAEPSFAIG